MKPSPETKNLNGGEIERCQDEVRSAPKEPSFNEFSDIIEQSRLAVGLHQTDERVAFVKRHDRLSREFALTPVEAVFDRMKSRVPEELTVQLLVERIMSVDARRRRQS